MSEVNLFKLDAANGLAGARQAGLGRFRLSGDMTPPDHSPHYLSLYCTLKN
jgi:hypothetical protein